MVGLGSTKCKYDVGGMKPGGPRGVDWCTDVYSGPSLEVRGGLGPDQEGELDLGLG